MKPRLLLILTAPDSSLSFLLRRQPVRELLMGVTDFVLEMTSTQEGQSFCNPLDDPLERSSSVRTSA